MSTIPFRGAWSIGTSERSQPIIKSVAPGPGTYQPTPLLCTASPPKWTLLSRNPKQSAFYNPNPSLPAPGDYTLPSHLKIPPPSKKPKDHILYNQRSRSVPRYYGSYLNLPSSIDTKRGFAFGYRSEVKVEEVSPGPTYNVNEQTDFIRARKIRNKASGFGFGEKNSIYREMIGRGTPGPGAYDSGKENRGRGGTVGGNIVFSKDQRKLSHGHTNHQLGPGSYNPSLPLTQKSCRITGRQKPQKPNPFQNIGPGSYKIPQAKSPTSVRFVQSKRQSDTTNRNSNPSPCQYSPKRFPQAYTSCGFRMGYAERKTVQSEETPGPGEYEVGSGLSRQAVTIGVRLKKGGNMGGGNMTGGLKKNRGFTGRELKEENGFNPNYDYGKYKSPAFSFPTEPLPADKQCESARNGPGAYTVCHPSSSEKYSISKAPRFKQLPQSEMYFSPNIPSGIGCIPKYLMKSKKDVHS